MQPDEPCHGLTVYTYKGFAPRAADAARYAGARKNTTKCEAGVKIRGPWFGAASDMMTPRATGAELIALWCCAAVCLLAMSRSDRQYGCNLWEEKNKRRTIHTTPYPQTETCYDTNRTLTVHYYSSTNSMDDF